MIERCTTPDCRRRAAGTPRVTLWENRARDGEPTVLDFRDMGLCSPCIMEGRVHKVLERKDVRAETEASLVNGGRAKPCWESMKVEFLPIQRNDTPEFTRRSEGPAL